MARQGNCHRVNTSSINCTSSNSNNSSTPVRAPVLPACGKLSVLLVLRHPDRHMGGILLRG
jgi:hypothetical protein